MEPRINPNLPDWIVDHLTRYIESDGEDGYLWDSSLGGGEGMVAIFNGAPACGAKTRRGTPCLCPAMANGRCKLHGGKVPSGPASVHFRHGHRTKASEQTSKDLTQVGRWLRLVDKLPPGQPVTPEIAELEADLRARFFAHDQRQAEWRRALQPGGSRAR